MACKYLLAVPLVVELLQCGAMPFKHILLCVSFPARSLFLLVHVLVPFEPPAYKLRGVYKLLRNNVLVVPLDSGRVIYRN